MDYVLQLSTSTFFCVSHLAHVLGEYFLGFVVLKELKRTGPSRWARLHSEDHGNSWITTTNPARVVTSMDAGF